MTPDRAIADAPRWMFLLILVYAPWAYGCTNYLTVAVLNQFSAALMVLWLGGCAWRRRWPVLSWLPAVLVAFLLLQGWWLAWNAHSVHHFRTWTTVNRIWDHPPLPDWPGAIDRLHALTGMRSTTALFALFLFACDLMTRPLWRKRVWVTMTLTALSVAVGGTVLKLGSPELREWVWDSKVAGLPSTFATYRYHGNAASLMSMGWALALGYVVAVSRRGRPLHQVGWLLVLLGLLFGLFINTSRAGWGLAVLIALLVAARFLWAWWHDGRENFDWRQGLIQGVVLLAVVASLLLVALRTDWREKLIRLNTTIETMQERYPSKVYHQLVREMNALGYGADCFQVVLPVYMEVFGLHDEKYGFWRHAHNDYYEYLANWGWWGLALWAVLIGGGLGLGLWEHFRAPVLWSSTQWILGFCGCCAIIGILVHALWDFPLEKASLLLFFLTLVADGWARTLPSGENSSVGESAA